MVVGLIVVLAIGPASASHLTVRSSDIVNGQVKSVDLGGAVVTSGKIANGAVGAAKLAPQAVTSPKIKNKAVNQGKLADNVLAARAAALILSAGVVDAERSANIAQGNVLHPSDGIYCIDLPFTPVTATATPHTAINITMNVSLTSNFVGCVGTEVSISTRNASGLENAGFMIQVY